MTTRKKEATPGPKKAEKIKGSKDYTGREFTITHEFAAPRDLVFKTWTKVKHLARWWGPRGFTNPVCRWDARPGKTIHVVMRAPNGTDYPKGGEFREIAAPERLVFTSGALDKKGRMLFEFLHTVTFAERKSKTKLTIKSRVLNATSEANHYIGGFEAGMTQSLERLAEYLVDGGGRKLKPTPKAVARIRKLNEQITARNQGKPIVTAAEVKSWIEKGRH